MKANELMVGDFIRTIYTKKMKEVEYKWDTEKKELENIEKKPVKWAKEDENMLDIILNDINYAQKNFSDSKLIPYGRKVNWLKSLRPYSQWKPSDEQMKLLKEACDKHWDPDGLDPLYTLYQELKKLTE